MNLKMPGKGRSFYVGAAICALCLLTGLTVAVLSLHQRNRHSPTAPSSSPPKPSALQTPAPTAADTPAPMPAPPAATPTIHEEGLPAELGSMTLREKICQMLIVTPDALTGQSETTQADAQTKAALEKTPVGGLIHFAPNIQSAEQITGYNAAVQDYSKIPLFIATDEEGGRVGRLKSALGAHSVGPMLSYEPQGAEKAAENAVTIGTALTQHGFNTDFAPVADVWSNPDNEVIGDRAYATDFHRAAELVPAAVAGFHQAGVVCALKHFPGHGDTREDSHDGTAHINKTAKEMRTAEFLPFRAGIAAGADMVMLGHLMVPQEDRLPATLSKRMVTDILRGELGFEGVVITDSLAMKAISEPYSTPYVAVTAVKAGVDILLMPPDVEGTIAALTAAVESGEIPESRIDESVVRILALKEKRGILTERG